MCSGSRALSLSRALYVVQVAAEAEQAAAECAAAHAALVPLADALSKEVAALSSATQRDVQLNAQVGAMQARLQELAALYPGLRAAVEREAAKEMAAEREDQERKTQAAGSQLAAGGALTRAATEGKHASGQKASGQKASGQRASGLVRQAGGDEEGAGGPEPDEDEAFSSRLCISLLSLLSTHRGVSSGLHEVGCLLCAWSSTTAEQRRGLDSLGELLSEGACVCMHMHACTQPHTRTHARTCIHASMCIHACATCVHTRRCADMHTCMRICMWMCMCTQASS